jgi:hypothetical protein
MTSLKTILSAARHEAKQAVRKGGSEDITILNADPLQDPEIRMPKTKSFESLIVRRETLMKLQRSLVCE